MGSMTSQTTSLTIVYSAIYSGADSGKHQRYTSLAFVRGIHRGPVTRKMFPFGDDTVLSLWKDEATDDKETKELTISPPLLNI